MQKNNENNPLKTISPNKIIYPIIIGLGVVGFMLYKKFDVEAFEVISFSSKSYFWLFVAVLFMIIRDIGYIIRIRILTDNEFTWRKAFRVIMLWEFTSAITPSAIGGTSVAILYVHKEGISVGRSSAVVMATSFLDELYFILMFPLLLLFINSTDLFAIGGGFSFTNAFLVMALGGYSLKFLYILVLSYGLFQNPRGLKWLLLMIFKLPILRRWKHGANQAGTEIIDSSRELKIKPFSFWLKAFISTFFSWTARYWVVNAIFLAFFVVHDHLLLFARQLVMWIMMLVSPTPGGSGLSEYVFDNYLSDFLPDIAGIAIIMALVWRLLTYYPYLIIGAIMLPKWLKDRIIK
jgi:glycosyltransferase 2 family protein